jgi:biopolymer transport protein ExbD
VINKKNVKNNNVKATIEPITSIMRIHEDDNTVYDCLFKLRKELRLNGVKQVQFTRIKNGVERTVTGRIK